jgi:hypothetical protein
MWLARHFSLFVRIHFSSSAFPLTFSIHASSSTTGYRETSWRPHFLDADYLRDHFQVSSKGKACAVQAPHSPCFAEKAFS